MGKNDSLFEHVNQSANRSICESIPVVPRCMTGFEKNWPQFSDSRLNKLDKLWDICENGQYRWQETWSLMHFNKVLSLFNGLSSMAICYIFRRRLKLSVHKTAAFNVYMPSVVASVSFGIVLHSSVVVANLTVNPLVSDHKFRIVQSGLLQVFTSLFYPLMFGSFSSIYFASHYNIYPIPSDLFLSRQSRKYLMDKIFRPVFQKNRRTFGLMMVVNLMAGLGMCFMESEQIKQVYSRELTRMTDKQNYGK